MLILFLDLQPYGSDCIAKASKNMLLSRVSGSNFLFVDYRVHT